jgi:hypothetical protein
VQNFQESDFEITKQVLLRKGGNEINWHFTAGFLQPLVSVTTMHHFIIRDKNIGFSQTGKDGYPTGYSSGYIPRILSGDICFAPVHGDFRMAK